MEDYLLQGTLEHIHGLSGFDAMKFVELEPGHAVVDVQAHEGLSNIYGKMHGGAYMVLIDMTASAAGFSCGKHVITVQSSTNFMRSVEIDDRIARVESNVVFNGHKTMMIETKIFNADGKECVRNESTMYVPGLVEPDADVLRAPGSYDCNCLPEKGKNIE